METPIDAVFGYAGTGLSESLLWAARRYYRHLINLVDATHPMVLPYAGIANPGARHSGSKLIEDRKLGGRMLHVARWGHSQGGLEAAFQTFRSGAPLGQNQDLICFSAPFGGSPAARLSAPLRLIPRPLYGLFEGIVELTPGSASLEHLQYKICAAAERLGDDAPHVHLVASLHDHLVPVESAWRWPDDYPAEKVHRVLLGNGVDHAPAGVQLLDAGWGRDNHVRMIGASQLHDHVRELLTAA